MAELKAVTSQTLGDIFSSQCFLKVGFQLGTDLHRLASSYHRIPAFCIFEEVVEVFIALIYSFCLVLHDNSTLLLLAASKSLHSLDQEHDFLE